MKKEFVKCPCCKREMPIEELKYVDEKFNYVCEDCHNRLLKIEENNSFLDILPPFEESGLEEEAPYRDDFRNPCEYGLYCLYAVNGSDLHLKVNSYPVIRKGGRLFKVSNDLLTQEDIIQFCLKRYKGGEDFNDCTKTIDYSDNFRDVRFKANIYHDVNGICVSLRLIRLFSTDFRTLGLPEILKKVATKRSGLILITGPTGSGKTTSLSALINYLNYHTSNHIITLEDPIEYLHESKGSIISQREVGRDCSTFEEGIIQLLREDPDIIVIGEMRDKESIRATLRAVETGHIVFSTLHTKGAVGTISRIVDTFGADEQDNIRSQLASGLLAVCSQQLVPSTTKGEVVLATELLLNNVSIASSIRGNKTTMIPSLMQMAQTEGMHTMKTSLDKLYQEGKIDKETYDNYLI